MFYFWRIRNITQQSGNKNENLINVNVMQIMFKCLGLFFFVVLGFELRAYILSHSTGPFSWWIFRGRSHELFAWAGLEPRSSWVARIRVMSNRCPVGALLFN
jgi:hypothetical protein